jgi:hypothetical protein
VKTPKITILSWCIPIQNDFPGLKQPEKPDIFPVISDEFQTMTPVQKKAVDEYRKRQKEKGFVRVEVNIPETDKPLIRDVAKGLRSGGETADKIRTAMKSALNPYSGMDLRELLENSPLDELDLERSKETWRDIEL